MRGHDIVKLTIIITTELLGNHQGIIRQPPGNNYVHARSRAKKIIIFFDETVETLETVGPIAQAWSMLIMRELTASVSSVSTVSCNFFIDSIFDFLNVALLLPFLIPTKSCGA